MSKRTVVHFELPSRDYEETQQFYSDLFGFEFAVIEQFNYYTFRTANTGGGLAPLMEATDERPGIKPGDVLVYFDSDDIDADLVAIEAKGGTILEPKMEIPGQGWLAVFEDPTGNKIGLWQVMAG